MTAQQITYLVFGIVLLIALVFDLGLLSRKNKIISIRNALYQTLFWVILAMAFFVFIWMEDGEVLAFQYLSGYLMEWSLSIDNIFVFILIFSSFSIKEKYSGQVLMIGILMAVIFRVIFITLGVALVERFEWVLYIFGAFLVYTGIKMFSEKEDAEFDPQQSRVYKFLNRFLPLVPHDGNGRYIIREHNKPAYTTLFVVVIMLAVTDLIFAFDSIPAVMGISRDKMVIYTSNIFAVLGLRSMFFLLKGAVNKFGHLQQGIAIVLVFIGLKMLAEIFHFTVPIYASMMVIVVCIGGSIAYSIHEAAKKAKKE
ncbi:MAG: TerC/Alx family metal homeostasis membrane protein [Chitinophagaceae bacterium]|jgi:tellurite resistance protein TerC|nr:TerC/Alx family metal homeostasis membrane protein [Chitinophagaceae bacterium]OQY96347.1 MAG: tellurium resistance protein TerC [Sphingobacteriales bacterium UTBCD1]